MSECFRLNHDCRLVINYETAAPKNISQINVFVFLKKGHLSDHIFKIITKLILSHELTADIECQSLLLWLLAVGPTIYWASDQSEAHLARLGRELSLDSTEVTLRPGLDPEHVRAWSCGRAELLSDRPIDRQLAPQFGIP